MSDSYLTIARNVLAARAQPLSAQEILLDAKKYALLPPHLSGETMQKTLQARLAEDIYSKRGRSEFYRTSLGTYYLRSLANDRTLPANVLDEFPTKTRHRPYSERLGRVLHVARNDPGIGGAIKDNRRLSSLQNAYGLVDEMSADLVPVSTISLMVWNERIFTHQVGAYSKLYDMTGRRVAGLKRYVDEYDVDLFEEDSAGIELSAFREVARLLIGTYGPLERLEGRALGGFLTEKGLCFVRAFYLHGEYDGSTKRRLDVNSPKWVPIGDTQSFGDHWQTERVMSMLRAS